MDELLWAALAWSPATLLPVVLWAWARTGSAARRRGVSWVLFLGMAIALAAAVERFGYTASLQVINPFFDPRLGKPVPFVVDSVTMPAWQTPLCLAIYWGAGGAWLRVRAAPRPLPCPVTFTCLVTGWTLCLRLAWERSAAPAPLLWAVGITMPTLVLLPFVGWWAGRRGDRYGKLLFMGLCIGLVQRGILVVAGWCFTLWGWGTHLDVGAIERVHLLLGEKDFGAAGTRRFDQWWSLILVPQLLLWVPLTVVLTAVLGTLPWRLARRAEAPSRTDGSR